MFTWLTDIMSTSLEFINGIVNNYGVAIIILTIIIKLLLYPMTAKQTKSMKKIQDLQPEVQAIQNKYKDNKEKQQQEVMKLYKENNVNMAAGCLPLVLTMIIIIPLYRAIFNLDMSQTTFLWMNNLAQPDIPLLVINIIAMISQTYLTQKQQGSSAQSNIMMWSFPLLIAVIGFRFPAGVLIYWLTQTVLTIVQQYIIYNDPELKGAAAE